MEGIAEPELGQYVHLSCLESLPRYHDDMTIASVLSHQISCPPQPLHGIVGAAPASQPAEQGAPKTFSMFESVREAVGDPTRIVAIQNCRETCGCRSFPNLNQMSSSDLAASRFESSGDESGLEPRKGGRDDFTHGLAEARRPTSDVGLEKVQPQARE
jgi:hypothetical protein